MEKTVVIVDDSPFMVDLLHEFFTEQVKLRVVATGNNGMQAISLFRQHRPNLITMDLTMPVKDGKEALKVILAEFPEARVLVITSQLGPPVVECLKLGAVGYVEKPLQFDSQEFSRDFIDTVNLALSEEGS